MYTFKEKSQIENVITENLIASLIVSWCLCNEASIFSRKLTVLLWRVSASSIFCAYWFIAAAMSAHTSADDSSRGTIL